MKNALRFSALGFQHVLAMYAGAVVVPLIVGQSIGLTAEQLTYLVAIDIFMCGIATLLQVMSNRFFGIGLPVVLGCTFTAVTPMIQIGKNFGVTAIYGAIIVTGIIIVLISGVFGKLVRFFPPVVTGSVVTIIGVTLIPVAMTNMGGGDVAREIGEFGDPKHLILSFGTLIFIILIYRLSKGFLKAISILIGLVFGTIAAYMMGMIDLTPVKEASLFHFPQLFYFGMPTFNLSAIVTMLLVAIVSLVESSGVYFALGDICDREIKEKDLAKGYRAEGLAITLGGLFNAFPYTTFSQNVGLIQMSGVKTRKVIYIAGGMLVTLGFIPKFAAIATIIPDAVLGGAMIVMFGLVVSQGIKMLGPVVIGSQKNSMIVACSIGLGLGVSVITDLFQHVPDSIQILISNGIVMGSFTAIILNIFFNIIGHENRSIKND